MNKKSILILSLLWACSLPARAVEITPETLEFRGNSGEKLKKFMTVRNNSSHPVEIQIEFWANRSDELKKAWLTVTDKNFMLEPNESRKIKVTCKAPKTKGEVTGTIFIKKISRQNEWVEVRSQHQVYVQIIGTEIAQAHFSKIDAKEKDGKIWIDVALKNTGNVHLQPRLVAELEKETGQKKKKIFESQIQSMLPNDKMFFSTSMVQEQVSPFKKGILSAYYHDHRGNLQVVQKPFLVGPSGIE